MKSIREIAALGLACLMVTPIVGAQGTDGYQGERNLPRVIHRQDVTMGA